MAVHWRHQFAIAPLCIGLLVGCGQADEAPIGAEGPLASPGASGAPNPGSSRSPEGPAPGQQDVAGLIERALAARALNDPEFAPLVRAAGAECPDPSSARRLGDVAAIAARWSSAVQDGRPKAQAVAEAQLDAVEWDALVAACGTVSE